MQKDKYEALRLDRQLCFPLYAAAKEVVRKYTPLLEKLGLTYTQYITLLVLWEGDGITVKNIGERLYLDSGTLTPVLKSLEKKSLVIRKRSDDDERSVIILLTKDGLELRERAISVPEQLSDCTNLSPEQSLTLYELLYKVLENK